MPHLAPNTTATYTSPPNSYIAEGDYPVKILDRGQFNIETHWVVQITDGRHRSRVLTVRESDLG